MSDWQTYAALTIVGFAMLLAFRTLVLPFVRSMKTPDAKSGGCAGGCGCAKSNQTSH